MDRERIVAVIMAGGGGTRFWPRSRQSRPKQYLAFDGQASLLRRTVERLEGLVPPERTFVITAREHLVLARQHARLPERSVIGEPCGRDTAACIGLGALVARAVRRDAVMVVLSADHLIEPADRFRDALLRAATLAAGSETLVTLGVRPDRPATGYGYVQAGDRLDAIVPAAWRVVRFREKPDVDTARTFVAAGTFLWNTGIFAFQAGAILAAIGRHLPDLHQGLVSVGDPWNGAELDRVYPALPRISIDYGVLERATDRVVVEAPFSWDDLGTFEAVARHAPAAEDGNLARGGAVFVGSRGAMVDNDCDGVVVVCGVDDVLVVRTADAVLVIPRRESERVKEVVKELERRGFGRYL